MRSHQWQKNADALTTFVNFPQYSTWSKKKTALAFLSKCEGLWNYFICCAANKTLNACVTRTSVTTTVGRHCGKVAGSGRNCTEGLMNTPKSRWTLCSIPFFFGLSHRFFQHQDLIAWLLLCFNVLTRMFLFFSLTRPPVLGISPFALNPGITFL